jgi:WD40 repeat protein
MGRHHTVLGFATGQQVSTLQGGRGCIAYAPDGKTIAAYNYSTAIILDVATRQLVSQSEAYEDWMNTLAFSPDGSILAIGYHNGRLVLWKPHP